MTTDDYIKLTVMALREILMEYYKGTCIKRMVTNDGIWQDVPSSDGHAYRYRRREQELAQTRLLYLGDAQLLRLSHNPDEVVFYDHTFARSGTLRKMKPGVEAVFENYLRGVRVIHDDSETPGDPNSDIKSVKLSKLREQREPQRDPRFYIDEATIVEYQRQMSEISSNMYAVNTLQARPAQNFDRGVFTMTEDLPF